MARKRSTRRKSTSYKPTRRRSTAASRARATARRRSKAFALWRKRLMLVALIIIGLPVLARVYIHYSVRDRVFSDVYQAPRCRVAMVLGAKVMPDGQLSRSLASRVNKGVELWREGRVDKLLMSGDNRFSHYNEPKRMAEYAIRKGVPRDAIVMDFAGRRTYDSAYRAKHIFGLSKIIVVTQGFHVDRAVFLCDHIGLKAYGVSSSTSDFRATVREMPACLGALADVYLRQPRPVLGKKEPIR